MGRFGGKLWFCLEVFNGFLGLFYVFLVEVFNGFLIILVVICRCFFCVLSFSRKECVREVWPSTLCSM